MRVVRIELVHHRPRRRVVADFNIRFLGAAILPKVASFRLSLSLSPIHHMPTLKHGIISGWLIFHSPLPLYLPFVTAAIIAEFEAKSRCTRETGEKIAARSFDHCAHAFRGFER